jgi:hypothetical protein
MSAELRECSWAMARIAEKWTVYPARDRTSADICRCRRYRTSTIIAEIAFRKTILFQSIKRYQPGNHAPMSVIVRIPVESPSGFGLSTKLGRSRTSSPLYS